MSDVYAVEFTAVARKQLAKLDRSVQLRIIRATELLTRQPRPPTARRLTARSELWRVRVGDHRVIYAVAGQKLLVTIVRIGHRSDVYRGIDGL